MTIRPYMCVSGFRLKKLGMVGRNNIYFVKIIYSVGYARIGKQWEKQREMSQDMTKPTKWLCSQHLCMFNYQCHFYLCNRVPYVKLTFVPNMLSSWNKDIIIIIIRLKSAGASAQSDQSLHCALSASAKDPSFPHADSEDSYQTGGCPGWSVFAGRTVILLVLSWGGSNIDSMTSTTTCPIHMGCI